MQKQFAKERAPRGSVRGLGARPSLADVFGSGADRVQIVPHSGPSRASVDPELRKLGVTRERRGLGISFWNLDETQEAGQAHDRTEKSVHWTLKVAFWGGLVFFGTMFVKPLSPQLMGSDSEEPAVIILHSGILVLLVSVLSRYVYLFAVREHGRRLKRSAFVWQIVALNAMIAVCSFAWSKPGERVQDLLVAAIFFVGLTFAVAMDACNTTMREIKLAMTLLGCGLAGQVLIDLFFFEPGRIVCPESVCIQGDVSLAELRRSLLTSIILLVAEARISLGTTYDAAQYFLFVRLSKPKRMLSGNWAGAFRTGWDFSVCLVVAPFAGFLFAGLLLWAAVLHSSGVQARWMDYTLWVLFCVVLFMVAAFLKKHSVYEWTVPLFRNALVWQCLVLAMLNTITSFAATPHDDRHTMAPASLTILVITVVAPLLTDGSNSTTLECRLYLLVQATVYSSALIVYIFFAQDKVLIESEDIGGSDGQEPGTVMLGDLTLNSIRRNCMASLLVITSGAMLTSFYEGMQKNTMCFEKDIESKPGVEQI